MTSSNGVDAAVVERMVALVRILADNRFTGFEWHEEAIDIHALLPEPVDPDLIEARAVVCAGHHDLHPESPWHIGQAELIRDGNSDNMLEVRAAYNGIKRGRELSEQSK